jgi:bifunctional DNA-binding transcriptional regulator/antitoxin component of YhaV-PrlF toxin-antitoxin module
MNMSEVVIARRKIWLQGRHSKSITLPNEWCHEHGWEVGDEILIKTDGKRLILEKVGGEE